MADKKELAARVLELVGGADNVVMATHCITRLRFNLKDDSKADLEALKTLDGALGAQVKDGQWQVIIGASVGSVYDELEPMLGDRMGGEVSADAEQPELQKGSARVFDIITGIFSAIIPALVAGGIVKGILAAIAAFGIDTGAGDFAIFNMISDIPFYFLPFLLAMSTADKFRVNRSLALCVAGSLMYPTIVNAAVRARRPLRCSVLRCRFLATPIPCSRLSLASLACLLYIAQSTKSCRIFLSSLSFRRSPLLS